MTTDPPGSQSVLRAICRGRALVALALALALLGSAAAGPRQTITPEYRLKAAILYRFVQFVNWPAPALDGRTTLDICVLQPNPFGRILDDIVSGEALGGRRLVTRSVGPASPLTNCQVLFVPAATPSVGALDRKIGALPILTVGDGADFLDAGGIIQLRVVANAIRFEVDLTAARAAGISLSSQLLRLASDVRGGTP